MVMEDPLPASVDLVVIGTGLGEAMVAAAAARSGASVLHLDDNTFYGGEWASFNLRSLDEWLEREMQRGGEYWDQKSEKEYKERMGNEEEESAQPLSAELAALVHEGEQAVRIHRRHNIRRLRDQWTPASELSSAPAPAPAPAADASAAPAAEEDGAAEVAAAAAAPPPPAAAEVAAAAAAPPPPPTWRQAVEEHWRRFSIDLSPKVLLARGDLVRTLCDSEVSAYAEFKLVDRLLGVAWKGRRQLEPHRVPCSRSDIFDSEELSMIDKRRLMKMLQLCMQWHVAPEQCTVIQEAAETYFEDFLATQSIDGSLLDLLARDLSFLVPSNIPTTRVVIEALCRFMDSVGVFGASPFLVPLYGTGELPQCFARLCAVFGGTYCLGRPVDAIVMDAEGRVTAVLVAGQRVQCAHLIMTSAFAPDAWVDETNNATCTQVARGVLIATGSVKPAEKESISLVNLAGAAPYAGARLLEAGWEGCIAPRGYYVAHVTADGRYPVDMVEHVINGMYRSTTDQKEEEEEGSSSSSSQKPLLLRSIQWMQEEYSMNSSVPSNVGVLRLPDESADYRSVMEEAKAIFARFWPDRDFLPRALKKDPEDSEPFDAREEEGEAAVAVEGEERITTVGAEGEEELPTSAAE